MTIDNAGDEKNKYDGHCIFVIFCVSYKQYFIDIATRWCIEK